MFEFKKKSLKKGLYIFTVYTVKTKNYRSESNLFATTKK